MSKKSINLTPGPAKPQVEGYEAFNIPAAASMPSGVTGQLPVPPGRVVAAPSQKLPPDRLAQLKRVGWKPGQPIPRSLQPAVDAALAAAQAELVEGAQSLPDVDPEAGPLKVDTVDIGELPAEEQVRVKHNIKAALSQDQTDDAPTFVARGPVGEKVLNARELPTPAAVNPKKIQPKVVTAATVSDTGVGNQPRHCQHCGWDLSVSSPVEPSATEKLSFIQSILGQKPFVREYSVMGGAVTMVFRSLTTRETDACFVQVYRERDRGDIATDIDFFERVNRLRLYLQLQRIRSSAFDHDLPEGLSKETNPNSDNFWEFPADAEEPLVMIEKYLLQNVLVTATLNRIAMQECGQFNRLVSKMEGMVDNENFWTATEA